MCNCVPAVGRGGAGEPSGPALRLGPQLRLLVVVSGGGAGARSTGRTLGGWRAGHIVQLLKVADVLAGDGAVVGHAVGEGLLRLAAGLGPARDGGGNGTGRDRGGWPE